jgi:hypothetical protein
VLLGLGVSKLAPRTVWIEILGLLYDKIFNAAGGRSFCAAVRSTNRKTFGHLYVRIISVYTVAIG